MQLFSSFKRISSAFYYIFLCSIAITLLTSCESRKTIVNNLDEKEANEIIVYLSTRGVDAVKVPSKEGGGGGGGAKMVMWDISVNSDQALEAMSYLNQAGLPRRKTQNLLGIFTGAGLVPSEMEQKIRYQAGLAETIASTIRKIDGILDAEVQISFPEEDPLNPSGEKKQKITASVYIKHNGVYDDPNSHLASKIKRLVAASVAGLDYDNVTIIAEKGRFSDLPIVPAGARNEEEKQYVNVWTVIVAKESLSRFRLIFFTFTLLLLLLLLFLVWMIWKVHPLLKTHGGLSSLFHLKPIEDDHSLSNSAEKVQETAIGDESKSKEEISEKDIDHT